MVEIKNIAIIGLGLIGGSMAKAIADKTDYHIMARNRTRATLLRAIEDGAVHEELTDDNIGQADMIILGLYPEEAVEYMESIGNRVKKGALAPPGTASSLWAFTLWRARKRAAMPTARRRSSMARALSSLPSTIPADNRWNG